TATLTPEGGEPETHTYSATATRIDVDSSAGPELPKAQVITAAGADADAIRAAVNEYKALFGEDNGGQPGPFASGFRTSPWDGVPADQSAPNAYLPDFFNAPTAPRARGAEFTAPAGSLMVSAGKDAPRGIPQHFGNINIQYASEFKAFSPDK